MKTAFTRKLPPIVVPIVGGRFCDLQEQAVQNKFSKSDAIVDEHNTDYVALTYLVDEAKMYWLPRFLDYAQYSAKEDSFHLDVLLFRLSEPEFSGALRKIASEHEVARVNGFLEWLATEGGANAPSERILLDAAKRLWA